MGSRIAVRHHNTTVGIPSKAFTTDQTAAPTGPDWLHERLLGLVQAWVAWIIRKCSVLRIIALSVPIAAGKLGLGCGVDHGPTAGRGVIASLRGMCVHTCMGVPSIVSALRDPRAPWCPPPSPRPPAPGCGVSERVLLTAGTLYYSVRERK